MAAWTYAFNGPSGDCGGRERVKPRYPSSPRVPGASCAVGVLNRSIRSFNSASCSSVNVHAGSGRPEYTLSVTYVLIGDLGRLPDATELAGRHYAHRTQF